MEPGWAPVRDAWGHGCATEAATALRDAALGLLDPTDLVSLVQPENDRPRAVAERLGADLEGAVETAGHGPALVHRHGSG